MASFATPKSGGRLPESQALWKHSGQSPSILQPPERSKTRWADEDGGERGGGIELQQTAAGVQFCCSKIIQASQGSLGPTTPDSPVVLGSLRLIRRDAFFSVPGGDTRTGKTRRKRLERRTLLYSLPVPNTLGLSSEPAPGQVRLHRPGSVPPCSGRLGSKRCAKPGAGPPPPPRCPSFIAGGVWQRFLARSRSRQTSAETGNRP